MTKTMKTRRTVLAGLALAFLSILNPQLSTTLAQGTAFTYQGRLNNSGNPASGSYDMAFSLFATNSSGVPFAGPVTNTAVAVSNGLFTTMVDFGNVFTGGSNWLEIAVSTNGANDFVTLAPRQQLTPVPYAITAQSAGSVNGLIIQPNDNGAPNMIGGSANNFVAPGTTGAVIAGGGGTNFLGNSDTNSIASDFSSIGGGSANEIDTNASDSVIAGGYLNQIQASAYESVIGGGAHNQIQPTASYSTIGGGNTNQIQTGANESTIGGGYNNQIQTSAEGSTIGGGKSNAIETNAYESTIAGGNLNQIQTNANDSTIGGGYLNQIQTGASDSTIAGGAKNAIQTNAYEATIGGGYQNQIQNAHSSTIGGGYQNQVQNDAGGATVGGGERNVIQTSAYESSIGGGVSNTITGQYGTIPGGDQNLAATNSFAAGHRAKAGFQGDFVWADSTDVDFTSTGNDQFLIRANGGVGINTSDPAGSALNVNGTVTATAFVGDGSGLTNISSGGGGGGTVTSIATGAGLTGGPITTSGTISIPASGVLNSMLANSSVTVAAGTGLSGGGAVSLGGSTTLNNNGVLSVTASLPLASSGGQNPNISLTGTVPDAQLSANIPRLNGTNAFTGTNIFSGGIIATNGHNAFVIENRTSDPLNPAVGQIWLITP